MKYKKKEEHLLRKFETDFDFGSLTAAPTSPTHLDMNNSNNHGKSCVR